MKGAVVWVDCTEGGGRWSAPQSMTPPDHSPRFTALSHSRLSPVSFTFCPVRGEQSRVFVSEERWSSGQQPQVAAVGGSPNT